MAAPINVLPSWGTNKVAINYKLGWNSPEFIAYLEEWLRIPQNLELVVHDTDFSKIPARVLSFALLHRKCLVVSSKRGSDGAEVLRYDATVKSVGKGPSVRAETVSMKDIQNEWVRIIYPLVLKAAQEVTGTDGIAPPPPSMAPPPKGPKVWLTLKTEDGTKECTGILHLCDETDTADSSYTRCEWGEIVSETRDILMQFIEYVTRVETLDFLMKGTQRTIGHITVLDMVSGNPDVETRLGKTHQELSKRHDVVNYYQDASTAKAHIRTALLEDPHRTYKLQVIIT